MQLHLEVELAEVATKSPFIAASPIRPPLSLHCDPHRFTLNAKTTVIAALDRFGQIAIFDWDYHLVCIFFVFRHRISAWMPDGTCFGPASPHGKPPSLADLQHFGSALARVSELGRRAQCK